MLNGHLLDEIGKEAHRKMTHLILIKIGKHFLINTKC